MVYMDGGSHDAFASISVNDFGLYVHCVFIAVQRLDDLFVAVLHKGTAEFSGPGEFSLVRVEFLVHIHEAFNAGVFGQGTVELKLKGMLMVEHEELSDVDNINENIRIRDELIAAFYEISEENDFNPVDSKALAERIGIDPEQFEIQFQVIEMMEYGNTLASGDVLITTDGKTYYEENYE